MMISINYNPEGFQWALSEATLAIVMTLSRRGSIDQI